MKFINRFISFLGGGALILLAVYYATRNTTAQPSDNAFLGGYLDFTSFIFIIAILVGVSLMSYGIEQLLKILYAIIFFRPSVVERQMAVLDKRFKMMGDAYYEGGTAALRRSIPFKKVLPVWQIMLTQLEAKVPIEDIQSLMDRDSFDYKTEINQKIKDLQAIAIMSPSLGVLGTVLGLVKLLANLKDVASIGPNMSLALLTTMYGIFIGTVLIRPSIHRLETVRNTYLKTYRQAMFWLSLIENKKPSFYVESSYSSKKKLRSQRQRQTIIS